MALPEGQRGLEQELALRTETIPVRGRDSARARLMTLGQGDPARLAATRSLRIPVSYPAIRGVMAGPDEQLWLDISKESGQGKVWRILGRDGRVVRDLEFPARFVLKAVEKGRAWGVMLEEDDALGVASFRIPR